MPEKLTRGQAQDLLAATSKRDSKFREALLKDPRAAVSTQLGIKIPANLTVKAVEETPSTIYVVVPFVGSVGEELSDDALEMVAGGGGFHAGVVSWQDKPIES